ncbi:HAD family hydrolase [Kiritimatiella glycovorans]|nr:HAD family hydrolase [Kiritimatiella glycovorans]
MTENPHPLSTFRRCHDTLVGIDSDGCVFDTVAHKQHVYVQPLIIEYWGLEAAADRVRELADHINLHSTHRGGNRIANLLHLFLAMREDREIRRSGATLPPVDALRAFIEAGHPLNNEALEREARRSGDHELQKVLDWSREVTRRMAEEMEPLPPFEHAAEALRLIAERSDAVVISRTTEDALVREWTASGLHGHVDAIAGQERGEKADILRQADRDYAPGHVLVLGDAPGDLRAARETGALFFPILPGREAESWRRFIDEGYERYLNGTFAGEYERAWIEDFRSQLGREG